LHRSLRQWRHTPGGGYRALPDAGRIHNRLIDAENLRFKKNHWGPADFSP
jgi:hypothetical protein